MKKAKLVFMMMALLILGSQFVLVQAYSPDYLPGGKNYLSADNFEEAGEYLMTIEPFAVKPYTDYCLTIPRGYYDNGGDVVKIDYYNGVTLVNTVTTDVFNTFNGIFSYDYYSTTFKTPANCNYISLSFRSGQFVLTPESIAQMQLEEGTVSTVGPINPELYVQGTLVDMNGPVFAGNCVVISNVDDPFTLAEIRSGITAIDSISGDVTAGISVILDEYTGNEQTLGEYTLVFQVMDAAANITDFECTVKVVDIAAPVISGPGTVIVPFPQTKTIAELQALLSASDNYDGSLSAALVMTQNEYTANAALTGTYTVAFSVEDASGNTGTYTLTINVVDDQAPVFTGITEMTIGYDVNLPISEIQESLSVLDGYDGDLTGSIYVKTNGLTDHEHEIGEYVIVFSVTDSSGNQSDKTVLIKIVDTIGPVIYYDTSIIKVYDTTVLVLADFTSLLKKSGELDPNSSYIVTVEYDSYSKFATTPGVYHLKLGFEDQNGKFTSKDLQIVVSDREADYIEQLPIIPLEAIPSFWQKFQTWIIGGSVTLLAIASNMIWFFTRKKRL